MTEASFVRLVRWTRLSIATLGLFIAAYLLR